MMRENRQLNLAPQLIRITPTKKSSTRSPAWRRAIWLFALMACRRTLRVEDRLVAAQSGGLARRLRYIVGRLQRAADSIETVVGEVLQRNPDALSRSHR